MSEEWPKTATLGIVRPILLMLLLLPPFAYGADMLTPAYYDSGALSREADALLAASQEVQMKHPLQNPKGQIPAYDAPRWGAFGAGKGPTRTELHHAATDLKVGGGQTDVELFAAYDGVVATFRDAPKYRHYISITKIITDKDGKELGKLVTLYAHVELDLDEDDGLVMDGKTVKAGDLLSKNLYSGTMGGPHLHFEIRYYRPDDDGTEEFYGFRGSVPGASEWPNGFWNPDTGYGFGHPENHGLRF